MGNQKRNKISSELKSKTSAINKYMKTTKGARQLQEAVQRAQSFNQKLREASRVDHQSLLKPITL